MKMKLILASLIIALSTMGSDCVNQNFVVAVNMDPLNLCYDIVPGSTTTFGGSVQANLAGLVGSTYQNNVLGGRVYDIQVSVAGAYAGNVNGTGSIQIGTGPAIQILSFNGSWANFMTPQSLTGGSSFITPNPAGIQALVAALGSKPLPTVTLSSNGSVSVAPVPAGLKVCIAVLMQADGVVQ